MELQVAVTAHSPSTGWGSRVTTNHYIYNHVGSFAAAGEAFAKALVLGGVTQRFPTLHFGFLEGGVAWEEPPNPVESTAIRWSSS